MKSRQLPRGFVLSLALHSAIVCVFIFFLDQPPAVVPETPIEVSELIRNLKTPSAALGAASQKRAHVTETSKSPVDENKISSPASAEASLPASAGKASAETLVEEYEVSSLPVPLTEVRVSFPSAARAKNVQGAVVFLLTISSQGKVVKAEPLSSPDEELSRVAQAALLKFKFKPALLKDKPVAIQIRYTYRFVLQ